MLVVEETRRPSASKLFVMPGPEGEPNLA